MSNNHSEDDSEIIEKNCDFGTMLSDARQAQGFSIRDIYENIKIPVEVLTALEKCDMAALPAATFTQGYIRSYAKFLEISEDLAIESYHQMLPVKPSPDVKLSLDASAETVVPSIQKNKMAMSLVVLVGVILFYIGFQYLLSGDDIETSEVYSEIQTEVQKSLQSSDLQRIKIEQNARLTEDGELIVGQQKPMSAAEESPVEPDRNESGQKEPAQNEQGQQEPGLKADLDSSLSGSNELNSNELDTDQLSIAVPTEENEAVSVATNDILAEDTISFYAQNGAWIELWDANEVRLFYDMLAEGGNRTLNGQAPFKIFMGNAITTRVEINNIEVDFSVRIRTNNTVRFEASVTDEQIIFH